MPATDQRIQWHTSPAVNERIRARTIERVSRFEGADRSAISARIAELEREWDIERVLTANAASVSLLGLVFGTFASRRWLALPALVAGFLFQHAVQGWCPPLPLFRRLGVRTASEIHEEIVALKVLRGDFESNERSAQGAYLQALLH